jgi:hypothetical protein
MSILLQEKESEVLTLEGFKKTKGIKKKILILETSQISEAVRQEIYEEIYLDPMCNEVLKNYLEVNLDF